MCNLSLNMISNAEVLQTSAESSRRLAELVATGRGEVKQLVTIGSGFWDSIGSTTDTTGNAIGDNVSNKATDFISIS